MCFVGRTVYKVLTYKWKVAKEHYAEKSKFSNLSFDLSIGVLNETTDQTSQIVKHNEWTNVVQLLIEVSLTFISFHKKGKGSQNKGKAD